MGIDFLAICSRFGHQRSLKVFPFELSSSYTSIWYHSGTKVFVKTAWNGNYENDNLPTNHSKSPGPTFKETLAKENCVGGTRQCGTERMSWTLLRVEFPEKDKKFPVEQTRMNPGSFWSSARCSRNLWSVMRSGTVAILTGALGTRTLAFLFWGDLVENFWYIFKIRVQF